RFSVVLADSVGRDRTTPSPRHREPGMAEVPRVSGPPGSVLVLNCGSSSVKFAVLDPGTGRRHLSGIAERLGTPQARMEVTRGEDRTERAMPGADHVAVVAAVLGELPEQERALLLGV